MDAKTLTVTVKGRNIAKFRDVTGTVYPAVWFWERCVQGKASIQNAYTVRGDHTKVSGRRQHGMCCVFSRGAGFV